MLSQGNLLRKCQGRQVTLLDRFLDSSALGAESPGETVYRVAGRQQTTQAPLQVCGFVLEVEGPLPVYKINY